MTIAYTELAPTAVSKSGWSTGWNETDISGTVGTSIVVEVVAFNGRDASTNTMGIRATTSTLSKYIVVAEAEPETGQPGGGRTVRFFTQVDANGNADFYYDGIDTDFEYYIIGYWSGCTFTDLWEEVTPSAADVFTSVTSTTAAASLVHNIHSMWAASPNARAGARAEASAVNRLININEAEGGGANVVSQCVLIDANKKLEVFSENLTYSEFRIGGYFSNHMTFYEAIDNVTGGPTANTWEELDLSTVISTAGGSDGDVVELSGWAATRNDTTEIGFRTAGGADLNRRLSVCEAESNQKNGWTGCVKTDANGVIDYLFEFGGAGDFLYFQGVFIDVPQGTSTTTTSTTSTSTSTTSTSTSTTSTTSTSTSTTSTSTSTTSTTSTSTSTTSTTCAPLGDINLYVNTLGAEKGGWTRTGSTPYLDASDRTSYISNIVDLEEIGDFGFDTTAQTGDINAVRIAFCTYGDTPFGDYDVYMWESIGSWTNVGTITVAADYQVFTINIAAKFDSWAKINEAKMYLKRAEI